MPGWTPLSMQIGVASTIRHLARRLRAKAQAAQRKFFGFRKQADFGQFISPMDPSLLIRCMRG